MKSLFASIVLAAVAIPGAAFAADEMKKCCCCEEMKKADCCDEHAADKGSEHAGHGEHAGHEAPAPEAPKK